MNDTLKAAGRIGAELGAAKAENEKLREALQWIADYAFGDNGNEAAQRARAALSQHDELECVACEGHPAACNNPCALCGKQAEPTDTYTAVDMATAAAQGFRDGQAAVEPAPAQDELLSGFCQWYRGKNGYAPYHPRGSEGAEAFAAGAEWQRTRPAQTKQQPVEVMPFQFKHPDTGDAHAVALTRQEVADGMEDTLYEKLADLICHCEPVGETNVVDCNCDDYIYEFELVNAAPIAQTAKQPEQSGKFAMHQRVRKTSGSEWQGRICGTYSTALTPEGYAVESEAHAGSVQIYPAKALEAVDD